MLSRMVEDKENINKSWVKHMSEFMEHIYPVSFKPFGLTVGEAYNIYHTNLLRNDLTEANTNKGEG